MIPFSVLDLSPINRGATVDAATALGSALSASTRYYLYAYNSAGTRTALSNLAGSATDTVNINNNGTTAITYYLRVVRYTGTGAYTLKLSQ